MHRQQRNSEFHLNASDLRRLIEAAPSRRDRLLVQTLVFTGIRRAEARAIHSSDIDFSRGRLLIQRGKGGKQRLVFLSRELHTELREYLSGFGEGYLFQGRDGHPMSLRNINYIVRKIGRLAGVRSPNPRNEAVTPHLLRHSFARNWKRAGGSMESLQKILGHASLKTTLDVYGTEGVDETEENYHSFEKYLVNGAAIS